MNAYVDVVESPAGSLAFAVDDTGVLLYLQFLEGRYTDTLSEELERDGFHLAENPVRTSRAREELTEYSAGTRREFDVPLRMTGSAWQVTVWQALTRIPYGETRSYAEVARSIGHANAARAVGSANAANRLPLVVPCHRVVGANGALGGYAGGVHLKDRLLAHEVSVITGGERSKDIATGIGPGEDGPEVLATPRSARIHPAGRGERRSATAL